MPLEMVSQFAYDRGQLVLVFHISVDLLLHLFDLHLLATDLHLLDYYQQEQSKDADDQQKRPEPETKP
jgi:hypothetical protein